MTVIKIRLPEAYAALVDDGLLTVADLERAMNEAASEPLYSALTAAQQQLLLDGSGLSRQGRDATADRLASPAHIARVRTADAASALVVQVSGSCTAREAGDIVGRDASTITRWHRSRALLGFHDAGGALRVPRWQFTADGPLPGLATVVARRGELSLAGVAAVMMEPNDELDGATPRDWLIAGGDPDRVGEILDGVNSW